MQSKILIESMLSPSLRKHLSSHFLKTGSSGERA